MSLDIDYYELLEVDRTADDKVLKAAYRKLAMQYHPDRNPGCQVSEARFKAINEAYEVLKDPQKRAAYDRFGKSMPNRSEEHTSELQSLMRISYAVFCLKKKKRINQTTQYTQNYQK